MLVVDDYSLLHRNTFGLDVRCARFVEYGDVGELRQFLVDWRSGSPGRLLHIGGGSNLLFTKDFDGTVLHSGIKGRQVTSCGDGGVSVRVGAGEDWDGFVAWCVGEGLHGLENLSLIPGEVGASAVQNIGAYGVEAKDFIESVEAFDLRERAVVRFDVSDCRYAYRSSRFKGEDAGRYAVTHVTYRLSRRFAPDLSYAALRHELDALRLDADGLTAEGLRRLVVGIRRRKLPDPARVGSAGSFFKNPTVSRERFEELRARYPGIPHYDMGGEVKLPAGWMIEQCGWKGRSLGHAAVCATQALVLVNLGGATGSEVVALAEAVSADVRARFGIELQAEVVIV